MAAFNIILLILGVPKMDNVSDISKPRIDILSLLLSTITFGGIVFALATLAELPLSDVKVWAPLVAGVLALILFPDG